jgi:hypothetical protein
VGCNARKTNKQTAGNYTLLYCYQVDLQRVSFVRKFCTSTATVSLMDTIFTKRTTEFEEALHWNTLTDKITVLTILISVCSRRTGEIT